MRRRDYRLVVQSEGDILNVRVDGDLAAARHQLLEVRRAAQKVGIPIRITVTARPDHDRSTTGGAG